MFLNYARYDLIKFTWEIFSLGDFVRRDLVLEPTVREFTCEMEQFIYLDSTSLYLQVK